MMMLIALIARYGMYAVLDPTAKLLYVKTNWDANYYNYAEGAIKEVVRLVLFFFMCIASCMADYSFQYKFYRTLSSSSGPAAVSTANQMDLDALPATDSSPTSLKSWIRSSVKQSVQVKAARTGHCQELHDYSSMIISTALPWNLTALHRWILLLGGE
jgi:hypothetical protein